MKTEYAYDAASRLTGLSYKLGAATLGALTYAYDAAGQRTKAGGSWARTLLPGAVATATYNAANHQTAFNGQTQTFDFNGNLTGDGTNTYTWDARNQLASISGPTPAAFVYDPLGRRQRKTVNGTATDFVHDGLNLVKEAAGGTAVTFLTSTAIDEYLTRTTGGTTEYLLAEALGSTVALTDGSGVVATEYSYEPFGDATTSGATTTNELTYTGREADGTSLYYYRTRYYHPGLQRFISEDPLEFATGDANLYVYVGNDPVGFTDPLGLDKQKPCGFADRFWKNFWTINDPLVRRPTLLVGGLIVGGEFTRLTGVPGPLKWTFTGMPRLQGYVPIAQTLGIVGAGATTYTFAQSAATVAAAGALRGGLVFTVFEIGVIFGSAVNAAAVQPLLGPHLGITGCEG